jgi:hypothetical protein
MSAEEFAEDLYDEVFRIINTGNSRDDDYQTKECCALLIRYLIKMTGDREYYEQAMTCINER